MVLKILLLGNSLLLSYNSLLPLVLGRPAEPRPGSLLLAASLLTNWSGSRWVEHWRQHWQVEAGGLAACPVRDQSGQGSVGADSSGASRHTG